MARTGARVAEAVTVMIVDDHPIIADAIAERVGRDGRAKVVAVARDARQAVEGYELHQPQVVLCDVQLGGESGIELTGRLRQIDKDVKVLMFSGSDESAVIQAALDAGAAGYVHKTIASAELVSHVLAVAEGRPTYDSRSAGVLINRMRAPQRSQRPRGVLSPRELDVLRHMARGTDSTKELAEKLVVSEQTVKTHISRIMVKLDVTTRAGVVSRAFRDKLISHEDLDA